MTHKPFKRIKQTIVIIILLVSFAGWHPTGVANESTPRTVAVFPLHNIDGVAALDWVSIALQDAFTSDLWFVSALNTKTLAEFNDALPDYCPEMRRQCAAEQTKETWQAIAESQDYDGFIHGGYQKAGEAVQVTLRWHDAEGEPNGHEISYRASLAGLPAASSRALLELLDARAIPVSTEERRRILSPKTTSVAAWRHNAEGFWLQQVYSQTDEAQREAIAVRWEAHLKQAVSADPNYAGAWNNLGWKYFALEDGPASEVAFRKALALNPNHIDAHMGLGSSLRKQDQPKAALPYLEKGVELNPNLDGVHDNLLAAYREAEQYQQGLDRAKALATKMQAAGREGSRINLVWWQAIFYKALEQWAPALSSYRKVERYYAQAGDHASLTEVRGGIADVYFYQARALEEAKDYEAALALYRKALALDQRPKDAAVYLHDIGHIHEAQQRYSEAIEAYQAALELKEQHWGAAHPQVAMTLNNLAGAYESLGEYAEAKARYERALVIVEKVHGPESRELATVLNNLAGVYRALGEYGEAKERYERALAIKEKVYGPEHPKVALGLNNLGLVYESLGEYGEAKARYERALAIAVNAGEPQLLWIVQGNFSDLLAKQGQR